MEQNLVSVFLEKTFSSKRWLRAGTLTVPVTGWATFLCLHVLICKMGISSTSIHGQLRNLIYVGYREQHLAKSKSQVHVC